MAPQKPTLVLSGACDHGALASQDFRVLIAKLKEEDLITMHDLTKAGKVTPVIDRSYRLNEVPEALRYLEEEHVRGNVVITFA